MFKKKKKNSVMYQIYNSYANGQKVVLTHLTSFRISTLTTLKD